MQTPPFGPFSNYVHEHVRPSDSRLKKLKQEIDQNNLTEMWDMILTVDYQVSDANELSYDVKEEFCGIIELLLKAFVK
jgi:predicted AlkP superfamily pyrophosphatase or phosphodiesterase